MTYRGPVDNRRRVTFLLPQTDGNEVNAQTPDNVTSATSAGPSRASGGSPPPPRNANVVPVNTTPPPLTPAQQAAAARNALIARAPAVTREMENIAAHLGLSRTRLLARRQIPNAHIEWVVSRLAVSMGLPTTAAHGAVLTEFMKVLPHLPTHERNPRMNTQVIAIAWARGIIQQVHPPANPTRTLEAMIDMVATVDRTPHDKSLLGELRATSADVFDQVAVDEGMDEATYSMVLRLGKTLLKGSAIALPTVAASMFKQDKAVNKAINLLDEAIRQWVPRQQLDRGLTRKITILLRDLPTEKGVHLQALYETLKDYGNPVDVIIAQRVLQNAGRM